jgi:hypothetical protein
LPSWVNQITVSNVLKFLFLVDCELLGCDAVWSCIWLSTFRRTNHLHLRR